MPTPLAHKDLVKLIVETEPALLRLLEEEKGGDEQAAEDAEEAAEELDEERLEDAGNRVGALAGALAERDRELGVAAARLLLSIDVQAARDHAERALPRLAPIDDSGLIERVLASVHARVLESWLIWLNALSPEAVANWPDITTSLEGLIPMVFTRRFRPGVDRPTPTDETANTVLSALQSFLPSGATLSGSQLPSTFQSIASSPVTSEGEAEDRLNLYRLLVGTADRKLATETVVSSLITQDLEQTLGYPVSATDGLARFALKAGKMATRYADQDELVRLEASVQASPWLTESQKSVLRLEIAAARAQSDLEIENPPSEDALIGLLELGEQSHGAVRRWLTASTVQPSGLVATLAAETKHRGLSDDLIRATEDVSASWTDEQREEFVRITAPLIVAGDTDVELLKHVSLEGVGDSTSTDVLRELFDSSSNNTERERVLTLWEVLNPESESARRLLINDVYVPMLHQGKGAAKIALDHFTLVEEPPSNAARDRLRRVMTEAARGDRDLEKRVERSLIDAGWIRGKRRLFGLR